MMAVNSVNSYSSLLRIGGLATGMDTDQLVKDLMKAESAPLSKLYQKRQLAEWRRDDYRSITNLLKGYLSDFFDVLKPASNMRSQAIYAKFTTSSSDSTVVTASGSSGASSSSHTITVEELASASIAKSTDVVTKPVVGTAISALTVNSSNKSFTLNVNGVSKIITIPEGDYADAAAILGNGSDGLLKQKVKEAFSNLDTVIDGSGGIKITSAVSTDTISLSKGLTSGSMLLENLGFISGTSNKLNVSDTISTISSKLGNGPISFDLSEKFKLTINSIDIEVNASDTVQQLISKVNGSSAGVTMVYSSFSDTFTLTSRQTGEGSITLNDNGSNFFTAAKLTSVEAGKNASFILDGVVGSRANNTFSIDGVTYNLIKKDPGVQKTLTLNRDADSVYNSIKAFVDKYNDIIDTINKKISEKYDRDYPPLTQEQKDSMKEEDIKKWEEKARAGLLKNDSILGSITESMRKALYDSVNTVSGSLSAIGITTGSYTDKGRLIIDELKLKSAIKNSPDTVADIFSKESAISYSPGLSASDKAARYAENGIINRLYDILQDNVRTIRDSTGKKGILLEKAGIAGDISEYSNLIYKEISSYDTNISGLLKKLASKEESYYKKFTAMEKAISKMNSQSSWLSSQLGQTSK